MSVKFRLFPFPEAHVDVRAAVNREVAGSNPAREGWRIQLDKKAVSKPVALSIAGSIPVAVNLSSTMVVRPTVSSGDIRFDSEPEV